VFVSEQLWRHWPESNTLCATQERHPLLEAFRQLVHWMGQPVHTPLLLKVPDVWQLFRHLPESKTREEGQDVQLLLVGPEHVAQVLLQSVFDGECT